MPEFKKNIGGPNLGNIPGVRAVKPHDSGAATAQIAGQLLQTGLQVGGRAAAQSAGRRIAGQEETAVGVDKAVTQASNELEMDVLLGGDQGQDLSAAQLEDIKKSKFDEVLGTQKRLKSALSRGLISSTEANARINMLRNEALANPLVAMFQGELDNQLFPSGAGGKGGGVFGATQAEKVAAARAKGETEAAEAESKSVVLIQGQTGLNEDSARALYRDRAKQQAEAVAMEQQTKAFNYGSKDYSVFSRKIADQAGYGGMLVINTFTQGGGLAEDVAGAVAGLENLRIQLKSKTSEFLMNDEGVQVGKVVDKDKADSNIDKTIDGHIALIKGDFSLTQKLVAEYEQRSNSRKLKDQKINYQYFDNLGVAGSLTNLGHTEAAESLTNSLNGIDPVLTKWSEQTDVRVRAALKLNDQDLGRGLASSLEKTVTGTTAKENPQEKEDRHTNMAILSLQKDGFKVAASYGKGSDEEIDSTFRNMPVNIRDIKESRGWMSSIRKDPNAQRAVKNMIIGASSRAVTRQSQKMVDNDSFLGPFFRTLGGALGQTIQSAPAPTHSGVPKKIQVTPDILSTGQVNRGSVNIDTFGVAVDDQYKSAVKSAYDLGTTNPQLWSESHETIDHWLTDLFARGELPEGEEEASTKTDKKEGFSFISNAGASELDPSEVDAGFPEELSSFAQVEDKQLRSDEGTEKNSKGENISYRDNAKEKNLTGGVGHLLTSEEKKLYPEGTAIPQAVVDKWFAEDIKVAESDVEALIPNAPDEVKSIAINMAFQLGRTKLSKFEKTLLLLEEGDFKEASKEMLDSDWAKQTPNRAKRLSKRMKALATKANPESPKSLLGDLDKIDKQRNMLKLFSANKNLTFQEMVDEGIIDTALEQELF